MSITILPEHLDIFPKPGKLSDEDHHLQPGEEASPGCHVKLPQLHLDLRSERIVCREKNKWNYDEKVDVGIQSIEVEFGWVVDVWNLLDEVCKSEDDQENPGDLCDKNFFRFVLQGTLDGTL